MLELEEKDIKSYWAAIKTVLYMVKKLSRDVEDFLKKAQNQTSRYEN